LWCFNSHPGIFDRALITKVGRWANLVSTHDETVSFATRTFLFGAHPKSNERPPEAIKDLSVVVKDGKTVVSFTAPASAGKLTFYQVKCAAKPLVPYEVFLQKFAGNQDAEVINWWMATNLSGEPGTADNPAPQAAGKRETFVVNGVPENASCFAVCSFDDSHNCSPISNVVKIDLK
jgi:hypothetical protein